MVTDPDGEYRGSERRWEPQPPHHHPNSVMTPKKPSYTFYGRYSEEEEKSITSSEVMRLSLTNSVGGTGAPLTGPGAYDFRSKWVVQLECATHVESGRVT